LDRGHWRAGGEGKEQEERKRAGGEGKEQEEK
jgi:hypothetical protein